MVKRRPEWAYSETGWDQKRSWMPFDPTSQQPDQDDVLVPGRASRYPRKICNTQNDAPCQDLAVWRVETPGRGYSVTGTYCAQHAVTKGGLDPATAAELAA